MNVFNNCKKMITSQTGLMQLSQLELMMKMMFGWLMIKLFRLWILILKNQEKKNQMINQRRNPDRKRKNKKLMRLI